MHGISNWMLYLIAYWPTVLIVVVFVLGIATAVAVAYQQALKDKKGGAEMYDSITRRHVAIGAAIERAAKDLPDGYTVMVELERGAGSVTLFIPPVSDDEPGRMVDDFCGDGFEDFLTNAVEMAIGLDDSSG